MATNKFYQFNPASINEETDAAYLADTQRAGGIATNEIVPSTMLNKVLHQVSTLVAALAQAMSNKGYNMDDSDLAILVTDFADLLLISELPTYFISSDGSTGYKKLPGGYIEQWGFVTMNAESEESIIFPVPFIDTNYTIHCTCKYTSAVHKPGATVSANYGLTGNASTDKAGCVIIADQYANAGVVAIDGVAWRAFGKWA